MVRDDRSGEIGISEVFGMSRQQQPLVLDHTVEPAIVKNGTSITMHWPQVAGYLNGDHRSSFYNSMFLESLISGYSLFNPHATFTGEVQTAATNSDWANASRSSRVN